MVSFPNSRRQTNLGWEVPTAVRISQALLGDPTVTFGSIHPIHLICTLQWALPLTLVSSPGLPSAPLAGGNHREVHFHTSSFTIPSTIKSILIPFFPLLFFLPTSFICLADKLSYSHVMYALAQSRRVLLRSRRTCSALPLPACLSAASTSKTSAKPCELDSISTYGEKDTMYLSSGSSSHQHSH